MLDLIKLRAVADIQKHNPNFLLCGSAALIMCGVLPNRPMSDIDLVINEENMYNGNIVHGMSVDNYEHRENDLYRSFYGSHRFNNITFKLNILIFEDSVKLEYEEFNILNLAKIKHQRLQDIINWKEKYNRPKDKEDLEKIMTKAIEESILTGEDDEGNETE